MFDKDRALGLLSGAVAELADAKEKLDAIRKEDGEVSNLKQKRSAVKRVLEDLEESLGSLREVVAAAVIEPPEPAEPETPSEPSEPVDPDSVQPAEPPEPETPEPEEPEPVEPQPEEPEPADPAEPEAPADLFSIEDQHAVSKLMQDSAVHLAVRRQRNFWEIRHRNTPNGQASAPIRATTIAEAYEIYEQQAVRGAGFQPFEPRALTPEEQQALEDFRNMPIDHPRSVRWEKAMTEVDYIDKNRHHAGGGSDDVQFPPGELTGPVEFLKTVLS